MSSSAITFPLLSLRQTVYHQPEPVLLFDHYVTSTLQLGDPSVIAHQCKVETVGDFRVADMAAGGQGAPLVPYLDMMLSKRHWLQSKRAAILVNIGGISNISACSPNGQRQTVTLSSFLHFIFPVTGQEVMGFDCGPGACLHYPYMAVPGTISLSRHCRQCPH